MPRGKKFIAEQIIGKLREAEVELARGRNDFRTVPSPRRFETCLGRFTHGQ
jgi:hypothetical protein